MSKPPVDCACPKCGEKIGINLTSALMDESRVSFKLSCKEPGDFLSAETLGGALLQMHKLLAAGGKAVGIKTNVVVEGITFADDGVTFNLLLTRFAKELKRKTTSTSSVSRAVE